MKALFELFRRFDARRIFGFIRRLGGACHVQKSSVTICVLPTPFRWKATPLLPPISMRWIYFYPRPPCGGRPDRRTWLSAHCPFLSTPSGWRATCEYRLSGDQCAAFLSTPSGRRATFELRGTFSFSRISIHVLRVEGDLHDHAGHEEHRADFYPRPPGGGRQQKRTKFSSVFAQKGEEFASLRRGKRKICRWRFKKDKFWVLIWCEGSGKSVCASASHCG